MKSPATPKPRARHSLSGKLILLFVVMAIAFVVLVGSAFRHFVSHHFKDNVQPHIVKYLEYVQEDLGTPPDPQRARQLADQLNLEIHIISGERQWSSTGKNIDTSHATVEHSHIVNGRHYDLVKIGDRDYLVTKAGDATLAFTVPHLRPERGSVRALVPLVILLIVLVVLYHGTRRLFSPIQTIQSGVKRFGQGELDHRIRVNRRDELGELAANFNAMADDIQQMLDAKRQLLLAISHELRSPLTRAKVATELMDNEQQKAQLNHELDEMESLIEELLETERLSTRHSALNKTHQNMNTLIGEVISTSFENARLVVQLPQEPVYLEVDASRIKLLLKNLVDNALRHTSGQSDAPRVRLLADEHAITIRVTDSGPGIEEKHLPHLTEPFYRADPSRQRETGGYGLGLYLCRMIAEAHGGKLSIDSVLGKGTTVSVEMPRQTGSV
jgi:signal transduction histidine kinase